MKAFLLGAFLGSLAAAETNAEVQIPQILGCPAYYVLKDKGQDTGEVRYLAKVTRTDCAYADLTGHSDLLINSKPKE